MTENIKLVQVGDGAVGKTCLLITYANNQFPGDYIPTVFDNYNATVLVDGRHISLGLWDIGGGEDYDRLRPLSYPETNIFMISFSIADRSSFENVRSKWLPEIREHCPDVPFVLAGLKIDLRDDDTDAFDEDERARFVTTEEGQAMADELIASAYFEVSAKRGVGVTQAFEGAIRAMWRGIVTAEERDRQQMAEAELEVMKKKLGAVFGAQRDELVRGSMCTTVHEDTGVEFLVIPSLRRLHRKKMSRIGIYLVISGRGCVSDPPRRKGIGIGLVSMIGGDRSREEEEEQMWKAIRFAGRKIVKRCGRGIERIPGVEDVASSVVVCADSESERSDSDSHIREILTSEKIGGMISQRERRELFERVDAAMREASESVVGRSVRLSTFVDAIRRTMASLSDVSVFCVRRIIVLGNAPFVEPSGEEAAAMETLVEECILKRISISCVGVGGRYDEEFFAATARRTGGYYYHAVGPSDVGRKVSKDLHGITSLLRAHRMELSVFPVNGLEILEVQGGVPKKDLCLRRVNGRSAPGSLSIPLGDLHYQDYRKLLFLCRVKPKTANEEFFEIGLRFLPLDSETPVFISGVLSLETTTESEILRMSGQMSQVFSSAKAIGRYANDFRVLGRKIATRAVFWKRKVASVKASFKKVMGNDPSGHLDRIIRSFFERESLLPLVKPETSSSVGRSFFEAGFDVDSSSDFGFSPGRDSDAEGWDLAEEEEEGETILDGDSSSEGEEVGEVDLEDGDFSGDDDFADFDDGEEDEVLILNEGDTLDDDDEEEGEVDSPDLATRPGVDDRFAGLMSPVSAGSSMEFEVVRPDELVHEQQRKIVAVADAIHSTVGVAGALLKHFQWNQAALCAAYIEDREKVCEEARVTLSQTPFKTGTEPEMECLVCFMDYPGSEMFALACDHFFCKSCWERYLHVKIADGPSCLLTLCQFQGCGKVVDEELVKEICPEEDLKLYNRYLLRSLVEDNPKIKWCPAPDCGRAVYCPDSTVENVVCECGEPFCFQCQKEAHQPTTCEEMERWEEKAQSQSSTGEWLSLNTKKCPRCWKRIEKNGGCNRQFSPYVFPLTHAFIPDMTCGQCNHEFCWMCMGPWLLHGDFTGGYYKCIWVSKKAAERKLERRRQAMEKKQDQLLKRLQQQYSAQKVSQGFETALKAKMLDLETELSQGQETAPSFLSDAATQLIHCRRTLKYTYVKEYFMKPRGRETDLFQHMQGALFAQTERLSELLENPPESPEQWDRDDIVSCTRGAKMRLENLLRGMKSGLTSQ